MFHLPHLGTPGRRTIRRPYKVSAIPAIPRTRIRGDTHDIPLVSFIAETAPPNGLVTRTQTGTGGDAGIEERGIRAIRFDFLKTKRNLIGGVTQHIGRKTTAVRRDPGP